MRFLNWLYMGYLVFTYRLILNENGSIECITREKIKRNSYLDK